MAGEHTVARIGANAIPGRPWQSRTLETSRPEAHG